MIKAKMFFIYFCKCTFISSLIILFLAVSFVHSEILLIDDFDTAKFINKLGGNNGIWTNSPTDKTAGCRASFQQEKAGYSLRLDYDIDSALTYFYSPMYILDYSAFSIIGLQTTGLPHVAFNGFYFLLGSGSVGSVDISKYKYLVFYVRGDENKGYTRRFQIELKTSNQISRYIVDGVTNKWGKFVIPLSVFERIDNWQEITEFTIVFNENVIERKGTLYFDNIYFTTDKYEEYLSPTVSEEISEELSSKSQLFLAGNLGVNYRYTPERKNEIFHSAGVTIEGQTGKVSGRIKSVGEKKIYPYTEFHSNPPSVSIPTIQFNVEELSSLLSRITLGNIWIGYSPYIIAPFWGCKGISISGRKSIFEHSTFFIKRPYNSFSVGNRSLFYYATHRLQLIGLYNEETAKLPSSTVTESNLSETEPVSFEYSYLVNTLFRFLQYRINFELNYGYYNNKEIAKADYSNSANPVYSHQISSPTVTDNLYEAKLFFDGIPFRGTKFVYSYRDVGTYFRPKYRQEPVVFEDVIADQKGHKIQFEQWYQGFNFNLYWDDAIRKSNENYNRRTLNYGVGYIGRRGLELKLNREMRTEEYKNAELKIDRNEKITSTRIYCLYNFLYPGKAGVRFPLTSKILFQEDNIYHPVTNKSFITHIFQVDLDYKLMTDLGFLIRYKTTRFGDPSWEPKTPPFDDNYLSAFFNINMNF